MAQGNLYRYFHSIESIQNHSDGDPKRTKLDQSDNDLELDEDDESENEGISPLRRVLTVGLSLLQSILSVI